MTNDGSPEMRKNVFRKFLSVYQYVTSVKCNFLGNDMYFSDGCFCNQDFCCNFAIGKQSKAYAIPHQIPTKSHLYSVAIREMQGSITNYHY